MAIAVDWIAATSRRALHGSLAGPLLLTALASAAATGAAQGDVLAGKVAFVTPLGQIAVVDPGEGEPRLLSPVGTRYQFPAFAPGGDRIAAIGVDGDEGTVAIADGRGVRDAYRSRTEVPIYLYWAPSGEILSFLAARPESGLGFWIAEGAHEARLVATGSPFYWSWHPDSESFLVHTGLTGPGARLAFARPADGIEDGNLAAPGYFQAPGFSASGRYVSYAAAEAGGKRRVVVASHPAVEGEIVRRAFDHEGFAMLGWHPSADLLAVMSPEEPAKHWFGPIRVLNAEDGLLQTAADVVALAFFWSPDGSKLAYLTPAPSQMPDVQQVAWRAPRSGTGASRERGSVWAQAGAVPATSAPAAPRAEATTAWAETVTGADPMLPTPTQMQERLPTLALHVLHLDGARVLADRSLVTFTPSAVFVNQFLPFFDQYAQSHRLWSPDGDALVLPMVGPDGIPRVVIVAMDGSLRPVAAGDMPVWNVR